ncbi:protein Skeletor, isoforms B/C isoform X2 [Maniola jurtina]|uniref:protein Skeletor, isoforms B/C isoform X2 n=1 Tax=Maniola jurtina TaxID=191418 RepID=UPI001E68F30D|nr:protein Skeletor, isoforms B/C isoform X2 [Maniola jurtina]
MGRRAPPSRGFLPHFCAVLLVLNADLTASRRPEPYFGRIIGRLTQYAHGIRGTVYAVDESTVFVRGFAYDGTAPDAFFWVGDTSQPSPEGTLVPYPEDYTSRDPPVLTAHSNSDILLRLPGGKRLRDIRWISVWCRRFTVNFGDVFIPPGLDPPRPRVLPEFKRLAHGLRSGNISVLDAKTFYIPNLHYDGAGPDAYFWVGNGSEPNPFGTKVPNEMNSLNPLRGYQGEDIEIVLPGKLTAYDVDWLAVWCVEYRHNFGHVYIPKDLDVPPALGQTKITTSSTTSQTPFSATNNCKEILDKRLQVRWEIQGDHVQITLSARLRKEQYMAFGLSGAEGRPAMLGADVVVAYWDSRTNQPRVSDYTITHLAQCDGELGVCPDSRLGGSNDAVVVSGSQKGGITSITYRRPLAASEPVKDKEILTTRPQSVIAAFGPLNSRYEANAHSFMDTTRTDVQIDFGVQNEHNCIGLAELDAGGPEPWPARVLVGVSNFTARIGPAGGKRGYTPITDNEISSGFLTYGHPSWGIAWYINDLLIPEIYVERGKSYIFQVEGGDDRTNPAKFHPFYISDSSEGGFGQKKEEDQRKQRVFAGVAYDNEGYPYPTTVGRYCEWVHKTVDQSATSKTFEDYMKTLKLECSEGEPAVLNWTVAHETPDLVYYQCYTHNNLGWKIHVVDPGTQIHIPGDKSAIINLAPLPPPSYFLVSAILVILTALTR